MRIVGIDPGKTTGIAVVEADEGGWHLVSRFDLAPEGITRGMQLATLYCNLMDCLGHADSAVMEEMLAYKQATADEKVEAQAIVKLATFNSEVELNTYAPATVRSVICRDGRADKKTIRETLRFLARAPKTAKRGQGWSAHQYDALAVALCHMARLGMVLDQCREEAA